MKLRPLTKKEMSAHSTHFGFQSDSPLVGWSDVGSRIVVDGDYVEIYRDWTGMYPDWALRFPVRGLAILFALDFQGGESDEIVGIMAERYGRVQQVID